LALIVLTTISTTAEARKLAKQIVVGGHAACVNLVPRVESIYRWKGKIRRSGETLLLIKTTQNKWTTLKKFICEYHPYEMPECIALPITAGLKEYLSWLEDPQ
jgi:periplasmic divalent cation tolerance protein